MKKTKVISLIMAIIMVALLIPNFSNAFTGELDPENYMTFGGFNVENGIGKATISVATAASSYTLSYQKVNITQSEYNNGLAKMNAYSTAVTGNASQEEINTKKAEFYATLPDYTSSWTATTLTSNNVTFDFTSATEDTYFVIWAKLSNGTNTYYDVCFASYTINSDETPSTTDDDTPTETTGEVTSFTNAVVSVEQRDVRRYQFTISGVTPKEGHTYYYAIGEGTTTPTFSTDLKRLGYDSTKKVLYSEAEISNYLELAKDHYVYVFDKYINDGENVNQLVLNKVKLDKPEQKQYTDVFYATIVTKSAVRGTDLQILFDTPWGLDTTRKVSLKIGKISDVSILKNIYNKKASAFEDLLSYAKSQTGFYTKTLNSNDNGKIGGGVVLSDTTDLLGASNITNGDYYFLYAVVDDENGKYVETEGVTFARASVIAKLADNYQLDFYGSDDFSWMEFASDETTTNTDTTTAKTTIPQTGESMIIFVVVGLVATAGVIGIVKYRKNNF